jgi:glycerophosphoryl diester phosphodiesterase
MQKKHPKLIAHRGNSSQAPENTLAAFVQALRIPVDYLECDVQLSKEGIPVVFHDSTLERISPNSYPENINELTLNEIKLIDAGSWFSTDFSDQRIITLEELLSLPRGRTGIMLEVKEETFLACSMGKHIGDVIKKMAPMQQMRGPLLVGSLSPNVLLCLEAYMPQQPLMPIVRNISDLSIFRSLHAKHYAFKYDIITSEMIDEFHSEGIAVWAWTVDDKDTAYLLTEMGIDGIITNHPKKMVALCHPSRERIGSFVQSIFNPLSSSNPGSSPLKNNPLKQRIKQNPLKKTVL